MTGNNIQLRTCQIKYPPFEQKAVSQAFFTRGKKKKQEEKVYKKPFRHDYFVIGRKGTQIKSNN